MAGIAVVILSLSHHVSTGAHKSALTFLLLITKRQSRCVLVLQAYKESARKHHPDKGGDAEVFAKIQTAFEVLSDPHKRAVYDEWAKEVQFRYVPGVTPKVSRGCIPLHVRQRRWSPQSHAFIALLTFAQTQSQ